jgi:type I restriction enzyme S subunit
VKGNRKQYKLEEVAEVFTGFPFKGDKYHNSEGTKVVRGENVTIGNLRWDTVKYWNEEFDEFEKYALDEGDIVIGMDGSRVGKNRAQIKANDLPLLLAQRVARIRAKKNFDQDFLAHIIKSDEFENYVKAVHTGTSIPHISGTQLKEFEFKATSDLKEQKQIASILSSLDNKIELNLQMNQTLEAMAQAIFKEWFVNFNFPGSDGKLVDGLPKGWKKYNLTELLDTISSTHKFPKGKAIFLNTSDILEGEFLHEVYSEAEGLPGQAKKSIKKGDILFSEIRPANKRYAFVDFESDDYVVSTKLMVLRSKGIAESIVLYFFIRSQEVLDQLQVLAESRSGTFPQITYSELAKIEMNIPDEKTLNLFTELIQSIFSKIRVNQTENRTLVLIRDSLLTKLMSGQIEIKA